MTPHLWDPTPDKEGAVWLFEHREALLHSWGHVKGPVHASVSDVWFPPGLNFLSDMNSAASGSHQSLTSRDVHVSPPVKLEPRPLHPFMTTCFWFSASSGPELVELPEIGPQRLTFILLSR